MLAVRNTSAGEEAVRRIGGDFEVRELDLASLASNMLGHFALTGLLYGNLAAAREARVVSLSSITHKNAQLDFDDLVFERGYRAVAAYGRSKLATTIFGVELDRRLRAAGSPIVSTLAHPGLTRTNLTPRAWRSGKKSATISINFSFAQ